MKQLCLILGDQLSKSLTSIKAIDKANDIILMAELQTEATYVKHHPQKIAFIFSAMRHFCSELQGQGYQVMYIDYEHTFNQGNFLDQVKWMMKEETISQIHITEPGEYRLLSHIKTWQDQLSIPVHIHGDDRFIASHQDFKTWAKGKKSWVMEYFYRSLRKKTGLLMQDSKPFGGKWNFDHDNRKKWKKNLAFPKPLTFEQDDITQNVLELVQKHFSEHPGALSDFNFAVTRKGALKALDFFIKHLLPSFGDHQDIMQIEEPFLYHSLLSGYINIGLLDPLEVCQKAEVAFNENHAPINAVEGFIRQILGWREFIRGIYWHFMPEYKLKSKQTHPYPLPNFFWNAQTNMRCLQESIGQTLEHAYAHHIQRLMVIGNFATLTNLDVEAVCNWYLSVYWDAFEWVELPNTQGMALHADGGIVGTKPYISTGNYINRMSNYCQNCTYNVTSKIGADACPFNYLYWNYLIKHEKSLKTNHRMGFAYKNLDRLDDETKNTLKKQADAFLKTL